MADFSPFDRRGYPSVGVREGYGAWQPTYEDLVYRGMDLDLLERVESVPWADASPAADLGCGTGRTGEWLQGRGVAAIDGVDLTPQMLARARERGAHRRLVEGDLRSSTLDAGSYPLIVCNLVDEHLPALAPLFREAARLVTDDGHFVNVSYHPFFLMASGMPTHFRHPDGHDVTIETHLHQLSDQVAAAREAGWALAELHEGRVDDGWIERKPKWERHRGWPISACAVWRRR